MNRSANESRSYLRPAADDTNMCLSHDQTRGFAHSRPRRMEVKSSACINSHFKIMRINLVAQEIEHLFVFRG